MYLCDELNVHELTPTSSGESNVALTTQIEIQRTMFLEDIPTFERSRVAEVEVDRW